VVSIVLKKKLHAMIDIAFGICLARNAVRNRLGLPFNDLESFFTREQKDRDGIPYEHVYRMYHEINDLGEAGESGESNLPGVMERYFQRLGLPRVRREQSGCLYDLDEKMLAYPPGLRVGGGLL
jgi:hypothetical protein